MIDVGTFLEMSKSASPPGTERECRDGRRVLLQAGSPLREANLSLLPEGLPARQCLQLIGQF